jgi:predicted  nucleic acid-binding Zn-ribbon protein
MRAEFRAKYAKYDGKYLRECKACGKLFYAYRPDAQTCSQRCRKAHSRSPAGALARLKRLGRSHDQYKADREQAAQARAFDRA